MEPGIHFCRHNPVFLNSCPQKEAFKAQVAYSNCVQFFTQFLRAKCIMSSSVSAYVPSQNAKSKSFFFLSVITWDILFRLILNSSASGLN